MQAGVRGEAVSWKEVLQNGLRTSCRDLHTLVDRHSLLNPLVRPGLTLAHYALVLQALYAINQPVEEKIANFVTSRQLAFDYAPYRRMADLASDLEFLGLPLPKPVWSGPSLDSLAQCLACLYVLIGATLGGQVIFRQLQNSLALDQNRGACFFAGHQERTAAMWQNFWDFAADVSQPEQLVDIQNAARSFFSEILRLLDAVPCAEQVV